jgi:protein TonB
MSEPGYAGPAPARRRARRSGGGPSRALTITLVVSLGLHVLALTAILLLLHAAPVVDAPDKPTEVELVMEEHQGAARPTAVTPPSPQPSPSVPPEPPAKEPSPPKAEAPPVETQQTEAPSPPIPVETQPDQPRQSSEPAKVADTTAAAPAQEAQEAPEPTQPAAQQAPKITLSGTDSPSDAKAWGDRIIPAAPDAVFHNRPPEYPQQAAENGEHGTVVLVIHISPAGTAAGADVIRSSGYVLLDRAARDAVMRWRFLPAVKDGQPVAADMTMGFVFDY